MIGIPIQAKLEIGTLVIEEITKIAMKEYSEATEISEVEQVVKEEVVEVAEDVVEVVEEAMVEISIAKIITKLADIGGILAIAIKIGHQIKNREKRTLQAIGLYHQTKAAAITKVIIIINQDIAGALVTKRSLGLIMMSNHHGAQLI